jgi:hypothetical protein
VRYKVRTKSAEDYDLVLQELKRHKVRVVTSVPRRHMVAVEDLSRQVQSRLHDLGAEVVNDTQYEAEGTS